MKCNTNNIIKVILDYLEDIERVIKFVVISENYRKAKVINREHKKSNFGTEHLYVYTESQKSHRIKVYKKINGK